MDEPPPRPPRTSRFPVNEIDKIPEVVRDSTIIDLESNIQQNVPSWKLDPNPAKTASLRNFYLSPSSAPDSRRDSHDTAYDPDSRRGSTVKDLANKVKSKTVVMSSTVKGVTKDASKWVSSQTGKKAKQAMLQATSGLSSGEKFILFAAEKIKVLSRSGFTHLFMFLVLVLYTALGAGLFMGAEGYLNEYVEQKNIKEAKMKLFSVAWNVSRDVENKTEFRMEMQNMFSSYDDQLHASALNGIKSQRETDWTFFKSMFFAATISTTIGYGHIAPKTGLGMSITIIYALIGIPLFLILMADFGKLFTRLLKNLFILIDKLKKSGTYKKARKHRAVQEASGKLKNVFDILKLRKSQEEIAQEEEDYDVEEYFKEGNFNLPVSLALFILVLYMIIGGLTFTIWEKWSTFEAFYFVFISMTTIGFGDLVPENPAYMMLATVYLVFGLALTAMSINIIQEKLSDTFRDASAKLKDSFKNVMSTMHAEEEEAEENKNQQNREEEKN